MLENDQATETSQANGRNSAGYRPLVLVADDDEHLRWAYREVLERMGVTVLEAEDGAAALDILNEHKIDLLVSDIQMPNVNGLELSKEARRRFPDLPIMLVSGLVGTRFLAPDDLVAATCVLQKPLDHSDFKTRVRTILSLG